MKNKKHHHRSNKRPHKGPRNAATGLAPAAPRPRMRSIIKRSTAPSWKTIVAAVAGGAGSAALGGLVVNQQILSPEAVGIGLMLGGGATAYFSDGMPRVVGTSVAACGAGQFALALMNKRAMKAHGDGNPPATNATPATSAAPTTPAQLAPPPAVRRSPNGGGYVTDLFRDAANDLETVEDEWRYGIRDDGYAAQENSEPIIIDLDEAA